MMKFPNWGRKKSKSTGYNGQTERYRHHTAMETVTTPANDVRYLRSHTTNPVHQNATFAATTETRYDHEHPFSHMELPPLESSLEYNLNYEKGGVLCYRQTGKMVSEDEIHRKKKELTQLLGEYIERVLLEKYHFLKLPLGSTNATQDSHETNGGRMKMEIAGITPTSKHLYSYVLVSSNYRECKKLIMFLASGRDLLPGIWNTNVLLKMGVYHGAMLDYIEKGLNLGYGIIVPNPNYNYVDKPMIVPMKTKLGGGNSGLGRTIGRPKKPPLKQTMQQIREDSNEEESQTSTIDEQPQSMSQMRERNLIKAKYTTEVTENFSQLNPFYTSITQPKVVQSQEEEEEEEEENVYQRVPVYGSATPEEHVETVWEEIIEMQCSARRIYFISYGMGGTLVKHIIEKKGRRLLQRNGCVVFIESNHRIEENDSKVVKSLLAHRAIYWEGSTEIIRYNKITGDAPYRTGCTCLSSGKPPINEYYHRNSLTSLSAYTLASIIHLVYKFLSIRDSTTFMVQEITPRIQAQVIKAATAKSTSPKTSASPGRSDPLKNRTILPNGMDINAIQGSEKHCNVCGFRFTLFERRHHCRICHRAVCNPDSRDRLFLPGLSTAQRVCVECANDTYKPTTKKVLHHELIDSQVPPTQQLRQQQPQQQQQTETSTLSNDSSSEKEPITTRSQDRTSLEANEDITAPIQKKRSNTIAAAALSIDDFDLLKVIGKGAFGKVMLVRRKNGNSSENEIYALKVLKKINVFAKNQVEHTKSERRILRDIEHPFIVRLRYAFQTEDKLYLVMDYYNGGSLFFHLRNSRKFSERRSKFYAAQLLLAMSHLHSMNIAYRDLKLENILMDANGYIALTDFGLSKENVDVPNGAKTFCGTAEYIAPELLKGERYGKAVDYWSYGTLLYEMLVGRTPFYEKNRKKMFYNILHKTVVFPEFFSESTKYLLLGLLRRDPAKRLGVGPCGAQEIMDHSFFSTMDWDRLLRKELPAVFKPHVNSETDTTNVAHVFTREIPEDSPVTQQMGTIQKANAHFDGFTYIPSSEFDP